MEPPASILIPTRDRLDYLAVTLASVQPQAQAQGAEVLVVEDGPPSEGVRLLAERHGARHIASGPPGGLNAARNRGVRETTGPLLIFLDDDVRVCAGWLEAMLRAAEAHPEREVFAGRILARLEGCAPRGCGRELPPITTLDLGGSDRVTPLAWGSNMAIRRSALERVGPFDERIGGGGDEEEWEERAARTAGAVRPSALYVAAAAVEHRRAGRDAELRALCRAAYVRGRGARRFDAWRGLAPSTARELRTLAGCIAHVVRRRCPAGMAMAAHSAGRLREALSEGDTGGAAPARAGAIPEPDTPDFLSGASGTVGGLDALRRRAGDALAATGELLSGRGLRLALAARHEPPLQRVLVLGVMRPERAELARAIRAELLSSRHDVRLATSEPGDLGKFENLNRLLAANPPAGADWLLVVDDDVELPRGFLDRFLFLCTRFSLTLAQPAHRLDSHAAWDVTRRRPGSVVRETSFVEIGPVTAFAKASFDALLPFPALRMGWGLDLHWAALARQQGWRCGVTDAVAIHHRLAPAGAAYPREQAIAEASAFLAERPYVAAAEAQRTLVTHPRW